MIYNVCEFCRNRFVAYSNHPPCKECDRECCEACAAVYDPDPPGYLICKECQKEAA